MSARSFDINVTIKKQGVIKVLDLGGGRRAVDYRGTKVVEELTGHVIKLNTNGWLTVTSKKAINRYFDQRLPSFRVFQKDFTWYLQTEGKTVLFKDNMLIDLGA